jgi:hypothetical protein
MIQFAFRMSQYRFFLDNREEREQFLNDWSDHYKFEYFELPNRNYLLIAYNQALDPLSEVLEDLNVMVGILTDQLNVELMQITINSVACKPLK